MVNRFKKNNFFKIQIHSTRIADIKPDILWQNVLSLVKDIKDKTINEEEQTVVTKSNNLFYTCQSTWKIEQITQKKYKLSVIKIYSGIVLVFLGFFLKKKLQKKTDLETQNLILKSL